MRALRPLPTLALLLAGAALLLTACGGGTKTVTVAGSPPDSQADITTQRSDTQTATQTAPAQTRPSATTSTTTRSAPEPAFAQGEATAEGASAAAAVVRAHGYTPNDTSEYHSNQTLRVLVGTRTGSTDGYAQQAFFFVSGRYLGTDTKLPSATVKVLHQGDTEATLGYPLYHPGDALASPSGEARVTFQLNNGKLVPLQKIPPASSRAG